jgi:hypothetical protein
MIFYWVQSQLLETQTSGGSQFKASKANSLQDPISKKKKITKIGLVE